MVTNHRKIPVLEFLFNEVAGLRRATLLKETPTPVLSCVFVKISGGIEVD